MKNLGQGRSKSDSDAIIDEKKRKRMMSNRESARRSRLKRQKRIEDLAREVGELTRKIEDYKKMLTMTLTKASLLETENDKLSAEKKSLADYLLECNLILSNCKQSSCFPIKKEISNMEPKLQMWGVQGHSQIKPIMASRMFTI
jgi:regulator of replication initiation timing